MALPFSIAGRVVEVLTGKVWDRALREELVEPLGLTSTVTLPEEALLHRAAVGHDGEGEAATPRVAGPEPDSLSAGGR